MNFGWIPSANAHQQKSNVIKLRELLAIVRTRWKTATNEKFSQDKWRTMREERERRKRVTQHLWCGKNSCHRSRAHTHKLDWLISNFCFRGHWLTPSNYFIEKVTTAAWMKRKKNEKLADIFCLSNAFHRRTLSICWLIFQCSWDQFFSFVPLPCGAHTGCSLHFSFVHSLIDWFDSSGKRA